MSVLRRAKQKRALDAPPFEIRREPYYVQTGSMFDNPYGVPPDEIVQMILDNPAEVTAQTVFGKYVESSGLVFTGELIQRMFDRSLPLVRSNTYHDEKASTLARQIYLRNRTWNGFFTGVDFARKTDYTVIFTLDVRERPARVVYFRRLNRVPWESIYAEVGKARYLFGPNILADATGPGGDAAMDALHDRTYCPTHHKVNLGRNHCQRDGKTLDCNAQDYLALSCVDPFHFTQSSKVDLVEHLRNVLSVGYDPRDTHRDYGWLRCPSIPQLEEEMAFYAWDDKKLETDCVFALALAAWHGLEDAVNSAIIGSPYGV